MSERVVILVVGLLLGLASSCCGYFAEATRPKRDDIIILHDGECVFPMSPAFTLGLVAAALLLLAVSLLTGCCGCCCKRRDGVSAWSFALGILLAVLSWLLALYAAGFFLVVVAKIHPGRRGTARECYSYVHADHLFLRPATKAIGATALGYSSYKTLR